MLVKRTDQTSCPLFLISDSISERSETASLSTCFEQTLSAQIVNSSQYLSRRQLKTISTRYFTRARRVEIDPSNRYSGKKTTKMPFRPIHRLAFAIRKKERKKKERFGQGQKRDRSYFWDSVVCRGNNDDKSTNNRRPLA